MKPENILITAAGDVKIIDFGAAVDMCTGINFNPLYGMLDPRYRFGFKLTFFDLHALLCRMRRVPAGIFMLALNGKIKS